MPKNHAEMMSQGSEADSIALMKTLHKIAPKMMEALGATGYNLGMNHGKIAGQLIFHTHLHVMPRYEGELRTFDKMEVTQDELAEVAEQIRSKI